MVDRLLKRLGKNVKRLAKINFSSNRTYINTPELVRKFTGIQKQLFKLSKNRKELEEANKKLIEQNKIIATAEEMLQKQTQKLLSKDEELTRMEEEFNDLGGIY